jgi:hypothetical protein
MFHYSFSVSFVGTTGNYQLGFASFFLGAVCSDLFGGVLILPRDPPTEEELRKIEAMGFLHHLLIYFLQLRTCQSDVAASIGYLFGMPCFVIGKTHQKYCAVCLEYNSSKI